ncbi:1-acyl-sn-glycerol-3-phosphate acyltransferase [Aquimixticola soesokkakensis]|uniref:1-acyl-sn-glycerol-3-phosphate acyltransferase n=1 Tax=Aquimixticola soesokkakensis TaxID=1519096 RepID=A0A1Y5SUE5_9RHOB|nr:lysophospholipid acyltransferase family protein [Aquimixticola soesokkakensis]SLN48675.1 1-acyl-sn-glycerol-3-phosphate acyltransferase [Aquimixticola soesokkakensis]
MPKPIQYLLSVIFIFQMYLMMVVLALFWVIPTLINGENAFRAVHSYCRWVRFSARWIVGLKSEIRGTPPVGEVIIASKHQSFFDIILIVSTVPKPKFIMKKELLRTPIVGWFATRIGCIAVDRGRGGKAVKKMIAAVIASPQKGQLIIFPQGTRVAPADVRPYKVGVGLIYTQTGQTCVPAATNVGVFWPRQGILRKRGLAVVEFLDPVPAGVAMEPFMNELETRIESASVALMGEAGFHPLADAAAVHPSDSPS